MVGWARSISSLLYSVLLGCGTAWLPSRLCHATTCLVLSLRSILKIDFVLLLSNYTSYQCLTGLKWYLKTFSTTVHSQLNYQLPCLARHFFCKKLESEFRIYFLDFWVCAWWVYLLDYAGSTDPLWNLHLRNMMRNLVLQVYHRLDHLNDYSVHSSLFNVLGRISTSQGKQYSTYTDYNMRQNRTIRLMNEPPSNQCANANLILMKLCTSKL